MQVNTHVQAPEVGNRLSRLENVGAVQNGSVLYEKAEPVLVSEGLHQAELIDVRRFGNVFGDRVGLVFRISTGRYAGQEIMEAAALSSSPRGKLAELLRGLGGGAAPSLLTATDMVGHQCRIAVRHEQGRTGRVYAAITRTTPT